MNARTICANLQRAKFTVTLRGGVPVILNATGNVTHPPATHPWHSQQAEIAKLLASGATFTAERPLVAPRQIPAIPHQSLAQNLATAGGGQRLWYELYRHAKESARGG